ncbi:MAG: hypothetical protein ABJE95_29350, partial [Byssovorax sp.]
MIFRTRHATIVLAALLPTLVLAASQVGCGKKPETDAPPPPVTVAPPPPPPPTVAAIVPEEPDAGSDAAADADAAKPVGTGGGSFATISKCCNALAGNAASA